MIVEKSNVVMFGQCQVQTDVCTAKDAGPVTAVWVIPGRRQLDVCTACLSKQLAGGTWEEEGAGGTAKNS